MSSSSSSSSSSSPEANPMDWSQIPSDLLSKIAGTLNDDIADRLRFAAVCKPWQSSLQSATNLPPVRIPWLLSFKTYSFCFSDPPVLRIFSLAENKIRTLTLPETRGMEIFAAQHDFFLTVSEQQTASLLNAVTKARVPLPSLLPLGQDTHSKVERCKLVRSHGMVVAVVYLSYGLILCCRWPEGEEVDNFSDHRWTVFPAGNYISDFAYHGGLYFVLDEKKSTTMVVDAHVAGQVVSVIPSVGRDRPFRLDDRYCPGRRRFLVESSSGEKLFLVIQPSRSGKERFEVFEFDQTEKGMVWTKVRSIGKEILFVDSERAVALPATDFNGYRENCIMFLNFHDAEGTELTSCSDKAAGLSSFDIGDDKVEKLLCWNDNVWDDGADVVWFVPGL